jgi:hypothetical protein
MTDLHGFLPPLTPTGKSALVPEMPWFYSGTLLTVEYLTDPVNVRAIARSISKHSSSSAASTRA